MTKTVNVYLFGKRYAVPENLTIMTAMAIKPIQLTGAVIGSTVSSFSGERILSRASWLKRPLLALACQTQVQDEMYIATMPFFPLVKPVYDINKVTPEQSLMMQLFPEVYACVGCAACTKACPQGLNVMQYIAYAQRGDFKKCADLSFDCVMCGICSSRCPAGISHPQVAMMARRLNGKYLTPDAQHLLRRVAEIAKGEHIESMKEIMGKSDAEIRDMYNKRDIEQ